MPTDIRYPIGFYCAADYSPSLREQWLNDIKKLPAELELAIQGLNEYQMHTDWNDGGWTIHQIVHHITDASLNGYIRCKFGYAEDRPVIRPFQQDLWIKSPEVAMVPAQACIPLLQALHFRWHALLQEFLPEHWQRTVIHPDYPEPVSLWYLLGLYSWHPRHHTAQIIHCRKKMGWIPDGN